MDASSLYIRSKLQDTVLLKPSEIGSNYMDIVQHHLVSMFEGCCSRHGFIRPRSITIEFVSEARVVSMSLNGDIHVDVHYYADVCNPHVGMVLHARVVKVNIRLGVMAHCQDVDSISGTSFSVIEAMVPRQMIEKPSEVPLDDVKEGELVFIEVLKKRFELNDQKISVIGRILKDTNNNRFTSPSSPIPIIHSSTAFVEGSSTDIHEGSVHDDEDASSTDLLADDVEDADAENEDHEDNDTDNESTSSAEFSQVDDDDVGSIDDVGLISDDPMDLDDVDRVDK